MISLHRAPLVSKLDLLQFLGLQNVKRETFFNRRICSKGQTLQFKSKFGCHCYFTQHTAADLNQLRLAGTLQTIRSFESPACLQPHPYKLNSCGAGAAWQVGLGRTIHTRQGPGQKILSAGSGIEHMGRKSGVQGGPTPGFARPEHRGSRQITAVKNFGFDQCFSWVNLDIKIKTRSTQQISAQNPPPPPKPKT